MTGYADGQPLYFRHAHPTHVGHGVVSVPTQPLVLRIRSTARSEPVGPVAGFVLSAPPVSRRAAIGRFVGMGRFKRRPPAAGEMRRTTVPPRARPSVIDSHAPLL